MTVSFRDDARILNRDNIVPRDYPFDLRVVTTTSIPSKGGFVDMTIREIDHQSPNTVVIAVDPSHRYVAVRYGKGVGISPDKWDTIEKAGNADFKNGNWTTGVLKIADSAASFKSQTVSTIRSDGTTTMVVQPTPVVYNNHSSSHTGWWIFGGIVLVALVVAYIWRRNQKQEEARRRLLSELNEEVAEKRALNREVDDWQRRLETSVTTSTSNSASNSTVRSTTTPRRYESVSRPTSYVEPTPRYVPPTYTAPVVPTVAPVVMPVTQQPIVIDRRSHTDDLLTGMMIGEMMHDHHTTRIVEREVVREPAYSSLSYSNDAGGTVSSFDDDNDAGGTVSTFDAPSPVYDNTPSYEPSTFDAPSFDPPSFNDSTPDF